jgi:hypothetical protein
MTIRKQTQRRAPGAFIDTLEIDANMLKRAKQILGLDSDAVTLNRALSMLIVNDEMESAIENAFGSVSYFKTS